MSIVTAFADRNGVTDAAAARAPSHTPGAPAHAPAAGAVGQPIARDHARREQERAIAAFAPQNLVHARSAYAHGIAYVTPPGEQYDEPYRPILYPLPPRGHPIYREQQQFVRQPEGRIRLLRSRSTAGVFISALQRDGVDILTDWGAVPDLLFLDPLRYFVDHPHINAIWVELVDASEYSASHASSDLADIATASRASETTFSGGEPVISSSSSAVAVPSSSYARVIRRSDLTHAYLSALREYQHQHFLTRLVCPPTARDFVGTLHGR
jgi:hypothetical protein